MNASILASLARDFEDFDIPLPAWLESLVSDDLYYIVALLVLSVASFNLGLLIGLVMILIN